MGDARELMRETKQMIDEGRPNDIGKVVLNYPRPKELVQCLDL